jgi:hypothetical protein
MLIEFEIADFYEVPRKSFECTRNRSSASEEMRTARAKVNSGRNLALF